MPSLRSGPCPMPCDALQCPTVLAAALQHSMRLAHLCCLTMLHEASHSMMLASATPCASWSSLPHEAPQCSSPLCDAPRSSPPLNALWRSLPPPHIILWCFLPFDAPQHFSMLLPHNACWMLTTHHCSTVPSPVLAPPPRGRDWEVVRATHSNWPIVFMVKKCCYGCWPLLYKIIKWALEQSKLDTKRDITDDKRINPPYKTKLYVPKPES